MCDETGGAREELTCEGDQLCQGGVCRDRVCEPGQRRCEGDTVLTCRPDGSGHLVLVCADTTQCREGQISMWRAFRRGF